MPKTDDSPFHLRMACLSMAESMLSQKMHITKEVHGNTAVAFFTTEDVMTEAAKLYSFVCDRDADETWSKNSKRRLQEIKAD